MTESMIERVARAMKAKLSADDGEVYFRDDGSTCLVDGHVDLNALARAAIEAMREPGNGMLEAMHRAMFTDEFTGSELPMLGAGFEAAIDAALNEQVSG